MQLTIDSSEPLDDALRVVGSLYGVTLTVADAVADKASAPVRRSGGRRPRDGGRSGKGRRSQRGDVDARTVREWATANGFTVNARGSLPASVRAAYVEAHGS